VETASPRLPTVSAIRRHVLRLCFAILIALTILEYAFRADADAAGDPLANGLPGGGRRKSVSTGLSWDEQTGNDE
jgi:hypothetical protein